MRERYDTRRSTYMGQGRGRTAAELGIRVERAHLSSHSVKLTRHSWPCRVHGSRRRAEDRVMRAAGQHLEPRSSACPVGLKAGSRPHAHTAVAQSVRRTPPQGGVSGVLQLPRAHTTQPTARCPSRDSRSHSSERASILQTDHRRVACMCAPRHNNNGAITLSRRYRAPNR